jgi:hypothetical protein
LSPLRAIKLFAEFSLASGGVAFLNIYCGATLELQKAGRLHAG